MTPDRWGYKVHGFPEFGTEFHLVGTYLEAAGEVRSINDAVAVGGTMQSPDVNAVIVHEDEFL